MRRQRGADAEPQPRLLAGFTQRFDRPLRVTEAPGQRFQTTWKRHERNETWKPNFPMIIVVVVI